MPHKEQKYIHVVPPEEFAPTEDDAVIKLAHLARDTQEYIDLIDILGLGDALCRSSAQRSTKWKPLAM